MLFTTWFFVLAPLALAAGAASFFGSHPTMAMLVTSSAQLLALAVEVCVKVAAAIGAKKVPELTYNETLLVAGALAGFVVAKACISMATRSSEVRYKSEAQALQCLREALPDGANVVVYEDMTASNWSGVQLHALSADSMNPYQRVRMSIGGMLARIDTNQKFQYCAFGSGGAEYIHNFFEDGAEHTLAECNEKYKEVIRKYHSGTIPPGGHTSFAEVAKHACAVAAKSQQFTVAVIVGDGSICPAHVKSTVDAVCSASRYRVGFVFVGVGNPKDPQHWALMKKLDNMSGRLFDNWQSIIASEYTIEGSLALAAVAEIVGQVNASAKVAL